MIRSIIKIDREACNGCGLCVQSCHEGAIALVDGKAQLIRDDYCDGLGNCLPVCPTGAITIEQREAAAYDEQAVQARMGQPSGCPGSAPQQRVPQQATPLEGTCPSQLSHWPVQIQLVPLQAPYLEGAHLLVAADCTPFAYGDFHNRFLRGRVALVGCPKLDPVDYTEKLRAILTLRNIQSVTVVRMEVPCCGGLERAARTACQQSGKPIPFQVVTTGVDGTIKGEKSDEFSMQP